MKIIGFKNSSVAIFGLGISGLAAAKALLGSGVRVVAWDDNPRSLAHAKSLGIDISDFRSVQWSQFAALILSPGAPLTGPQVHWCVGLAKRSGVEIIGDIELFVRERRLSAVNSPFIAVTGTNGKSTTVALISHILSKNSRDVQLGGNIGNPVMSLADFAVDRFYVIECSSYQIELTPTIDPSVGVLLNLSVDHLERHVTLERYAAIKQRLVMMSRHAVVCMNDSLCEGIASNIVAAGHEITRISSQPTSSDMELYIDGSYLKSCETSNVLMDLSGKDNLGCHNIQNTAAAVVVCLQLGLEIDEIRDSLSSFRGLTHRFQKIAQVREVVFINDSKATNMDSVLQALLTEKRRIYWIAGGLLKSNDVSILFPFLSKIVKAYFIGKAADVLANKLEGKIHFEISKNIDKAVINASNDAVASGLPSVVLFSPGGASFDQYKNFKERGFAFMSCVSAVKGVKMLVDVDEERQSPW
ncbi:UDP-N-acetylmuramoyl-L-alanine--D-glutamate ligase [Liberibacter sp. Z1]|nr:UDP-N-acetylmuramoyl-L-alanine--D-glutamate ligase [Candidatus Liberibacter sp.]MBA5724056.1 UDP-N-acetylmuramoyl-L-alanine--D-glutamate ligase [Candidatus Liberibacter sp.]